MIEVTLDEFNRLKSCVEDFDGSNYDIVTETTIDQLPAGEFLKLKPNAKKIYQRGNRNEQMYEILNTEDISDDRLVAGKKKVYIGFTY